MIEHRDVQLKYLWRQPSLRVLVVDDVGNKYTHPTLGPWLVAQANLFKSGGRLNRAQCKQLWKWLGRTDKAPDKLWVMVNREDLDRLLAKAKP